MRVLRDEDVSRALLQGLHGRALRGRGGGGGGFSGNAGESRLVVLRDERDAASANLAFEDAAALHAQVQKVEAVRALAPELVQPLSKLRAVILQPAVRRGRSCGLPIRKWAARGPAGFSTLGMRIQNEQSGSSSLFAQPMALEPVPEKQGLEIMDQGLDPSTNAGLEVSGEVPKLARGTLEARMEATLAELARSYEAPSSTVRQGHLALLKRWYYRPEIKRPGEIFFPDAEQNWPVKALLRGAGRVAAKMMTST